MKRRYGVPRWATKAQIAQMTADRQMRRPLTLEEAQKAISAISRLVSSVQDNGTHSVAPFQWRGTPPLPNDPFIRRIAHALDMNREALTRRFNLDDKSLHRMWAGAAVSPEFTALVYGKIYDYAVNRAGVLMALRGEMAERMESQRRRQAQKAHTK